MSIFLVLHTPVTSAPNDLAICTAKRPTPPEAPTIRTFCPERIPPASRRACRATTADVGTAAACANVRLVGFGASLSARARANSAQAPSELPRTAAPGRQL